jgi:hypothetical protein
VAAAIRCLEIDLLASFLISFGHKSIIAPHVLEHDCAISQSKFRRQRIAATTRKVASALDVNMKD